MYAIFRAGGKQYKVQAGDTVRVEKMERNLGDKFDLNEVLMVGGDKTFVGEPLVQNAKVTAVVTRQAKAPKVIVFKKKRRQGYRRMHGHRQLFTELFIMSITSPEGQMVESEKEALIIDPAKTEARRAAHAEKMKDVPKTKTAQKAAVKTAAPKKKKAAKKAGAKSGAKKSGGAKKKAAKKAAKKK